MTLYGRRNVLLTGERQLLAEVVEILSPAVEPADWPAATGRPPQREAAPINGKV